MQHKHRIFLLFYLFPICDLIICSSFYNLLYLCYGYYYEKNLLGEWWASRWHLMMRKWDGDGTRQEQERAKVLGACVIHTESSNCQASRGTFGPWPLPTPPRCQTVGTFHVYYTCISHFHTPFLLSLTITSSSSSITLTLITHLVSFFHSNSRSISTIDYRTMNKWLSLKSEINKKGESFCAYAACRRQAIAIDDR